LWHDLMKSLRIKNLIILVIAERGTERHDLELSLVLAASGYPKRFPFHNDECGKVVRNQSFLHWTVEPWNFCDCKFDFNPLKNLIIQTILNFSVDAGQLHISHDFDRLRKINYFPSTSSFY
jgi:hypothetical protein